MKLLPDVLFCCVRPRSIFGIDDILIYAAVTAATTAYTASQAEDAAAENRQFQGDMSSSAHQREVADLRAAGLNPVISAFGKGASTPGGATAQVPDYSNIVSTALQAKQISSNVDLQESQANLATESAAKAAEETREAAARADLLEQDVDARKPFGKGSGQRVEGQYAGYTQEQAAKGATLFAAEHHEMRDRYETLARKLEYQIRDKYGDMTADAVMKELRSRSRSQSAAASIDEIESAISSHRIGNFSFREIERGIGSAAEAARGLGNLGIRRGAVAPRVRSTLERSGRGYRSKEFSWE